MLALLLAALLIGGWELYATLGPLDAFLLPAPHEIATTLFDDRTLLWSNFLVTAQEVLLGLLVALAAALLLATAVHLSASVRRAVMPLVISSQTVPIPIIAPLLVAWFGYDLAPKLFIVALVAFFPIVVTTVAGLASVDPALHRLLATFDARRLRTLRLVEAQHALPGMLAGAKVAVAVAVIGAVLAEQAGSSEGLGHLILQAIPQLETARAYAAVVVLSTFAVLLYSALTLAQRRLTPWMTK